MKSNPPTATDLSLFLAGAGLDPGDIDLTQMAAAGAAEFNRLARRTMLAGTTAIPRTFTPPTNGNVLLLPDMAAAPTAIAYAPSGSSSTAWVSGTDYTLQPIGALSDGRPYTALLIHGLSWGEPLYSGYEGSISITARWGYGTQLSEDVWGAMLNLAAAKAYPLIQEVRGEGAVEKQVGDTRIKYGGSGGGKSIRDTWIEDAMQVVKLYKRVSF